MNSMNEVICLSYALPVSYFQSVGSFPDDIVSLDKLIKKELSVGAKLAKTCIENLTENHGIRSREAFLAAWRKEGRAWLGKMVTDEDEDLDNYEALLRTILVMHEKKLRVLKGLHGTPWTKGPAATLEWLGASLYAEMGRLDKSLSPDFAAYDILNSDPIFLERATNNLKRKMDKAVHAFAKVLYDSVHADESGEYNKIKRFGPIEHLGEGGFGVCFSVLDKIKKTTHAMASQINSYMIIHYSFTP